ncbi:MAG: hypothetical protein EP343_07555 [Deltaproteobacteria bacterium]|nr:MAG: hypothetical protein EP343_07555 [Deltaproteobacteria bacterium]
MWQDRVEHPWQVAPDEPSIQATLTQKLEQLLLQLTQQRKEQGTILARGITVLGATGLGKTHLLMRWFQRWHTQHALYSIRIPTQPKYVGASLLHQCNQSLFHFPTPQHPGFSGSSEQMEQALQSLKDGWACTQESGLSVLALEGWDTLRNRREHTQRWEDWLRALFAEIPNLVVLSVMDSSLWSRWMSPTMATDVLERIAHNIYEMEPLTPGQCQSLVRLWDPQNSPPLTMQHAATPRQLLRHLQRYTTKAKAPSRLLFPMDRSSDDWDIPTALPSTKPTQWDSYEWDEPKQPTQQESTQPAAPLGTLSLQQPPPEAFAEAWSHSNKEVEVKDVWKLPGMASMFVLHLDEPLQPSFQWEGYQLRSSETKGGQPSGVAELIAEQDDPTLWCVYSAELPQPGVWKLHPTLWHKETASPIDAIRLSLPGTGALQNPDSLEWNADPSHPALDSFLANLEQRLANPSQRTLVVARTSEEADAFALQMGAQLQEKHSSLLKHIVRAGLTTQPQLFLQSGLDRLLKGSDTEALQHLEVLPAKLRRSRDGHRTQRLAEQIRDWENQHQAPVDPAMNDSHARLVFTTLRHVMNIDSILTMEPSHGAPPRFHTVVLPQLKEIPQHLWKRCQQWARESIIWTTEEMEVTKKKEGLEH